MNKWSKLFCGVAALVGASGSASAAIIINGSFEMGTNPGSFATVPSGNSTTITGWTVAGGSPASVDYVGSYWAAADGVRSVDLDGSRIGAIYQDITTVPGQTYLVTFYLAGNPDGGPATKNLAVTADGAQFGLYSFTNSAATTRTNMGWTLENYVFSADNVSTRLAFASLTSGAYGPAIDLVSASAVPEPATWGMMLLGFGMMGFGLRARRQSAKVSFA